MQLIPRSYQIECVSALYNYFSKHSGNPICALPTGTGKSVVIAMFLESIFMQWPGQKILALTHVKELIEQNYAELVELWPTAPAGIYSAGLNRRDTNDKIIFAGIGSVSKRADEFGHVDLLVIDEAHLVSPEHTTMYQKFIAALLVINPNLKVIGFTATPWRLGHGHIAEEGHIFTDIAFDITTMEAFNRLIAEGYLSTLIPKRTQLILDTDGIHMRGGEFIPKELQNAVDQTDITEAALREAMELGADRKHWLIFAAGVNHAIHISDMLNTLGISCVAVHSKMKSTERDANIAAFKQGKVRAAVNNNVLTTGFNFPAIDMILVLRPTASSVLWVQMLGRGTRPSPATQKENCLVLDFANNTKRLGPINDPVVPKKKGKGVGTAPVKECDQCSTWNHASLRLCCYCGYEFPQNPIKLKQGASSEELIKGDLPVVEVFKVDHIAYSTYRKMDKPPILKATYYCNLKMFTDYVCIEHEGFARRKAVQWWRDRAITSGGVPESTEEALDRCGDLAAPTHLRVWINKKYPQIMAYCYDGTAFGMEEVPANFEPPTVENTSKPQRNTALPPPAGTDWKDFDDDIPF